MRVTRVDIIFGLQRLLEIYPRAKHLPDDPAKLAEIYHRELDDLDVDVFRAGVSAYCKSDARYFPKPGELRAIGQRLATPAGEPLDQMAAWEKAWPERSLKDPLPCPVCGAVDTWSVLSPWRDQRVTRCVPHDPAIHTTAGVGFVGRSIADLPAVVAA